MPDALERKLYIIRKRAVTAIRTLDEAEKKKQEKDIVEYVQTSLRKHPVWGWVVLGGLVFTVVATAVASVTTILKNFGLIG